jgi:hypothetical protein
MAMIIESLPTMATKIKRQQQNISSLILLSDLMENVK